MWVTVRRCDKGPRVPAVRESAEDRWDIGQPSGLSGAREVLVLGMRGDDCAFPESGGERLRFTGPCCHPGQYDDQSWSAKTTPL